MAALAGIASAALGLGVGELVGAFVDPASAPLSAVGSAAIDLAPAWAKDLAISLFGTGDKAALLVFIGVVVAAVAAVAGVVQRSHRPWGAVLACAIGVVGVAAAMTRAAAGPLAPLPSILAGLAAAVALSRIVGRESPPGAQPQGLTRRGFFVASGAAAVVGVALVGLSAARRGISTGASALREAVRLPRAASTATLPAGAELGVDGLTPVVTPNDAFYRIDTALVIPQLDPSEWSLRIHGMVEHEITITWQELLALPLEESYTTLACVSNTVGGGLVGNALWLGYPIRELLARAVPSADADMVLSRSHDGFTAGTPLETLTDERDAILAVGMNGDPLPVEHGFPVRMVVPGLYGYVSATKWVTELEVTRFDRARAYWTDRGWSAEGPIKMESRIDVPRGPDVAAGSVAIAGVAWNQHTGVSGVEVRIDDGGWQAAELATAISDDTWVQWTTSADLAPGEHTIRCRAIGADGEVQTSEVADPAPNGASGWHARTVTAA